MRLISSKQAKRRTALMFALALVLSNLLSLIGPSANAAVTITTPSAGTCFQHTGTVANGANVTVYSLGSIQISLTASEITPGQDAKGAAGASTGIAMATASGSISTNGNVIGNVFSIVPPTGTNFVIVPGFQDTTTGSSSNLSGANATISNAISSDGSTGAGAPDSNVGISVGVVTAGTAGIGRAIVALARDADSAGATSAETYPKVNTGSNTVSITINGLGLAVPPSGEGALSGTLQATLDATPPSGIGLSGGEATPAVSAAIPGLTGTINICTVTSAGGQLEAVLDNDDDATENYDKSGTTSPNLVALGSISSNSRVWIFDTATLAAGVNGTSLLDTEPILIRGTAGTGTATRDQVFATGSLVNDITSNTQTGSSQILDLASNFGNSVVAPITVSFADDNASALTSLKAVGVIIESSTTGAAPAAAGFNAAQTSRNGFLGALRAALFDSTSNVTNNQFNTGESWGVASVSGFSATTGVTAQETNLALANAMAVNGLGSITGNATEPFNNTFLDLRLECGTATNPVTGWFAILNSSDVAMSNFSTTADGQILRASQGGHKFLVNSATNLFTQALTNIAGSNPVTARSFMLAAWTAAMDTTATNGNALLYASCASNTLTLLPIQDGFDATRDIIAVTPFLEVTNVSNTFASDVQVVAQISGNNLTGTTTLNLAKLVGVPTTGGTSTLAAAQGVALAENSGVGLNCTSGGTSSVVLSGVSTGTFDAAVSAACTSGSIATPPPVFTGGTGTSVVAGQVVDGSPVVQGEGRGILIKELNATGFNELVSQIGGGTQGTVFEVQLPCDVIDDRDDNNTAASTVSGAGGNDGAKFTVTSTAGVSAVFTNGGAGDAALTSSNVIEPKSGANPARLRFRLATVGGTTDAATTDAVLVRIDSQDLFCDSTVTGDLTAKVFAQNKVSSPTITSSLGSSVVIGSAKPAFTFGFADDVATSTRGETSTNTMIGSTPRLAGGGVSTSHRLSIVEGDARSIPIGGRVSARNLDPDNSVLSTVLTRGQIWIVPASGSAFSAAPAAADVSFSDNSLVTDGNPILVTSATIDANAPLGTVIIGVKRNTASGAADPTTSTTTITVKNLKFASATSSTTDLISTLQFFSQDAGVVVNVAGVAAGNNSSTPTVFTPFSPGSTKASTQLNVVAAGAVQLGSGSLANSLLTDRLMSGSAPQLNPFAKVITSAMNADSSKISVSSSAVTSGGTPATDTVITVTGTAGAVDGGAEVVVTTGSTTYDTTTVVASDDGSFTAKLRGDCSGSNTSVSVSVKEQVSGTATTSVTKTALCSGGGSGQTATDVLNTIAGADGTATVAEVLSFVSAQGGLAAVISLGGATLDGVILAIKQALGLS